MKLASKKIISLVCALVLVVTAFTNVLAATTAQTSDQEQAAESIGLSGEGTFVAAATVYSGPESRTDDIINEGWTFTHGESASQNGTVNLPHTWNVVDTDNGNGEYYRGLGTYEKTLDVSGYQQGNVFIKFEAANKITNVYVDGEFVGEHIGGYTAFTFDITEYVKGKDSVELRVEVDNADNAVYIPIGAGSTPDYNIWGGIHRDVHIINTSEIYFALESEHTYASSGIYLDQSVNNIRNNIVTGKIGDATLDITANVIFDAPGEIILTARVYDKDGELVESAAQIVAGDAGFNEYTMDSIQIDNAYLWNGRSNGQSKAYLYRVVMSISDTTGKVLDQYTDRIGFRQFEYRTIGEALDAQSNGERGVSFLLNGEAYPLYGAAMHGDYYGQGNAIEKEHWDTSFALINEIGMNTIRAAHYPYPQYFYDQCDERGYVVWAENAATNGVPKFDAFVDEDNYIHSAGQLNAFDQVQELVLQNYNHPSIYTWCLMNEVAANGGGQGGWGESWVDDGVTTEYMVFMRQLDELIKSTDRYSDRMVSLTANFTFAGIDHKLFRDNDNSGSGIVDLIGAHYYYGTYSPGVAGMGNDRSGLTALQNTYPDSIISISEYGVGGDPNVFMIDAMGEELDEGKMSTAYNQISFPNIQIPRGDGTTANAKYHPIEYMTRWHEMAYDLLDDYPWVMGTYIWNMFDFGINWRNEGGTLEMLGRNDKGMVTYDRKTKKDPFFYYKAQWNEVEDFVHINTGNRWQTLDTNGQEEFYDIRVYSNIDYENNEVNQPLEDGVLELWVNGVQVGGAESGSFIVPERVQKHVYVFKNVPITSNVVNGAIDNTIEAVIRDYNYYTTVPGSVIASAVANKEDTSLKTTLEKYGDSGYSESPIIAALPGNNTELVNLIAQVESMDEMEYSSSSWANLMAALDIAKMVVSDATSVQEVIDANITYLNNMINALVRREVGDMPWVSVNSVQVQENGGQKEITVYLGRNEDAADSAVLKSENTNTATIDKALVEESLETVTVTGHSEGKTKITIGWSGGPLNGTTSEIPVTVVSEDAPLNTYPVIFMSDQKVYAIKFAEENNAVQDWPADPTKSNNRFDGWFDENDTQYTAESAIAGATTLYAKWTYSGSGSGSISGSSSGGGSSRGSDKPDVFAGGGLITASIKEITSEQALKQLETAVQQANASGKPAASVLFKNAQSISLGTLQSMVKATDLSVLIKADSMSGSAVDVRISFDPAMSTKDLNLTASTVSTNALNVKNMFNKWFANKVQVVVLGQNGDFGQEVELAVKIDSALDAESLVFYSYDSAANTYKRIENPRSWVDRNGYVHLHVQVAGTIIISDGTLIKS